MLSIQIEGEIIKQVCEWDDHAIVTWDYEGADVIYFPSQEEGKYDVNNSQLLEDLFYKDIPLTLYVRIENVIDRESVFIAWDHNGTIKYIPCAFEGVYVLNVSNLCKDLLYKDIMTKFHVYDTHDYFNTR
jgi:hypothetical protein